MNNRRKLFVALATGALGVPFVSAAQAAGRTFRIGFLNAGTSASSSVLVNAFREELSRLGWIEGKTFTTEYRFAELKNECLPELAAELSQLKVDLIVTRGTPATMAASGATAKIPIVMAAVADPVGAGLVARLARPAGNVTGLSAATVELNAKRLEILNDANPKLIRTGLFVAPGADITVKLQLKELRAAAVGLKLKLEEIETELDARGLERAFQTAKQKQVGAIMTTTTTGLFAERKRIVELADKYRLPAIYFQKEFVDEGGLMSYGVDFNALYRRATYYADRILKGAKPADLPVERPTTFELVVNMKTAKALGITVPPAVMVQATRVIQ